MLDGFYKARFSKSDGETILGLITLANGKLFGGNSDFGGDDGGSDSV